MIWFCKVGKYGSAFNVPLGNVNVHHSENHARILWDTENELNMDSSFAVIVTLKNFNIYVVMPTTSAVSNFYDFGSKTQRK